MIEFDDVLQHSKNELRVQNFLKSDDILAQFVLDPTSMHLTVRIHVNDPIVPQLFKLSRDICSAINKRRTTLLKQKAETETKNQS